MAKRKRRLTATRNVVLFAAAVLVLAGLIVYVGTRRSAPLMPPETPEELAMRTSHDNAYFTLAEAVKMLPRKPRALGVPDPEYPTLQVAYRPKPGSMGELLQIKRPDDDTEMIAYLQQCEPAFAKAREAFSRPYYREPFLWSDFEISGREHEMRYKRKVQLLDLARAMISHGTYVQRVRGDDTAAAADIVDAARLGLMLMTDCDGGEGFVVQYIAAMRLADWSHRASRDAMDRVAPQLRELQQAAPPALPMLEFTWRALDNTRRVDSSRLREFDGLANSYRFGRRLTAARRMIASHRDEFRAACDFDFLAYQAWAASHPELTKQDLKQGRGGPFSELNPVETLRNIVYSRTLLETDYTGVALSIAIERYQRDHSEYPESLGVLVPGYLESLPKDPFASAPYLYHRDGSDYWLYSVGMNGRDDRGSRGRIDDFIIRQPLEAEETG